MPRTAFVFLILAAFLFALPSAAQTTQAPSPATAPAPAAVSPEQAALLKSSEAYVRNLFAWGPDFKLELGPVSPSASPDFYTLPVRVTFNGQTDTGTFYVSKDGKTFMRGDMYDMSADAFADARAKIHLEDNPSKGPTDARITVVEFSDFQCPHCRLLYQNLKTLEPQYPQVRFVFKDFPLVQLHPWAYTAALGARCAFVQRPDAFWRVHNSIFDNQDLISTENVWEKVLGFGKQAGLDPDALKSCMSSPEAQQAVKANLADGQAVSVNSTPTVFVNGRPIVGGDKDTLQQYLNYEMRIQHLDTAAHPSASPPPKH